MLSGQSLKLLPRSSQIGLGCTQRRVGGNQLLLSRLQRPGADEVFCRQTQVAFIAGPGQCPPGLRIAELGLYRQTGTACASQRSIERLQTLPQVHRIHLGQELTAFDPVPDIHQNPQDPAGGSRPDHPATAGFYSPQAKNRRAHIAKGDAYQRHFDRGQRAGAQGDKHQGTSQGQQGHSHAQTAREQRIAFHDISFQARGPLIDLHMTSMQVRPASPES